MSRGLILVFTFVAAAALVWSAIASGPETVETIHAQLDGQLARSGDAFRAAAAASEQRALVLAGESAQGAGLVHAMNALSRRGLKPDQAALDAATGAVAARTEKRGEAERAVLLGVANERGAVESRMGEAARFDGATLPLAGSSLAGTGKTGWANLDGTLIRVAASPIGGDEPPEGALVLGYAVDDRFAKVLRTEIGADVTIVRGGKVVASSLPAAERSQLASAASGAGSVAFSYGSRPESFSFLGVALPVGGPDVKARRGWAFQIPAGEGATAIFSADAGAALAPVAEAQKRALGAAGLLVLLGGVFAFLARDGGGGAKVRSLAEAAEALVADDLSFRAPENLHGDLGRVADALNRMFSRKNVEKDLATRVRAAEAAARTLERKQNTQVTEPLSPPRPAPGPSVAAQDATAPLDNGERPLKREAFAGISVPMPTAPILHTEPSGSPAAPQESGDPTGPVSWDRPTQANSLGDPPSAARIGDKDFGELLEHARSLATPRESGSFPPEATVITAVPESLLRAASRGPDRPVVASPVPPIDPDEAHFGAVFRDFVATRERCGEPTEGLTYDRFAVKLRKNREQLVEKYRCRSVRFTVYVKEGKAALKATPIKD